MPRRLAHLAVCLLALGAYLLNSAAAVSGAVLCEDPTGASSVELACDHDHCATLVATDHEHDSGACWCASCPCEDRPVEVDVATVARDDDPRTTAANVSAFVLPRSHEATHPGPRVARARSALPALDRSLRYLRTVVLIV